MSHNSQFRMNRKKNKVPLFILLIVIVTTIPLLLVFTSFSKYIFFKKEVIGTVTSCESLNATYVGGAKAFSFSVEIKTETETINFSAEDRKWASINKGDKIKATYFVYPFWNLSKAGSFYEGRLIKKLP